MTRKRKSAGVPGVPGVPSAEQECIRARDRAHAPAHARMHIDIDGDYGDTGDTGDNIENRSIFSNDQLSPPVSPVESERGDTLAIAEVRALQVRFLAELPLPFSLELRDPELGAMVVISTSRARVEAARSARQMVWAPLGLEVAAYGVQEGLAGPFEWRWWCRELCDPSWRLTSLGGGEEQRAATQRLARARRARPIAEPTIEVGRLLDVVGAELVNVVIEEEAA